MSSAGAWQHGEPSGRPGLWSWRAMWRPCGPSLENSAQSSRTLGENEPRPSVNSVSRTSGSASNWPRWDSLNPPRFLGPSWGGGYPGIGVEALVTRRLHCSPLAPNHHHQASHTEQELQKELDGLRGQCQAQALARAELRTRLESLQGEVSAS